MAPICEVPHQSIDLECLGDRKLTGGFLADTNYHMGTFLSDPVSSLKCDTRP